MREPKPERDRNPIKAAREGARITATDLAKAMGISRTTLWRLEGSAGDTDSVDQALLAIAGLIRNRNGAAA